MVLSNLLDWKSSMLPGKKKKLKKIVLDDKELEKTPEMHANLKVKKHKSASERMKKLYGAGPKKKD